MGLEPRTRQGPPGRRAGRPETTRSTPDRQPATCSGPGPLGQTHPLGTAQGGIAGFADLPVSADDLRFLGAGHADLTTSHTVAGNPMRFRTGRIELRRDDAWRQQLPRRQQRVISALTAPLLARYGYSLGGTA